MTRGFCATSFSSPFRPGVTGRQRLRFHLKIDFGVDIGGVDGNMSQPRPDRVMSTPARRRCVAVV